MGLRKFVAGGLGKLAEFLAKDGDKAFLRSDVEVNSARASTKTVGAGETGKVVNKGGTVVINNYVLNTTEVSKEELLEAFRRGELQFVRNEAYEDLEDFNRTGGETENDVVEYFKDKIKPADFCLLRTGYYIRELTARGEVDRALHIKDGAVTRNRRARNIINLATAGYFEDYIRPIFESNNLEEAQHEYNEVVEYMPEIVFVSNNMTADNIVAAISEKVRYKEQYHLNVSKVMANGIGEQCAKNIEKAQNLLVAQGDYGVEDLKLEIVRKNGVTCCKLQLNL